ncbi:MAG TPA: zinc ribbon domain-containing protein [Nitrososphaeraceae archaeon]|nr:zinc ribbon domain-containing protein [Nitrososphaeraceae archaeon]
MEIKNHKSLTLFLGSVRFHYQKWNPYCIRHSSITADSDYLPEFALKTKVRWSMNSRQGTRYIKNRMGNDLKEEIPEQNRIVLDPSKKRKITVIDCPRCQLINPLENKYCSKCSYPLKPEAYEALKEKEDKQQGEIELLKNQVRMMMNTMDKLVTITEPEKETKKKWLAEDFIKNGMYIPK